LKLVTLPSFASWMASHRSWLSDKSSYFTIHETIVDNPEYNIVFNI
jgi:hypothetical protein